MADVLEYQIDIATGEFICLKCNKRFPTHYPVKKGFWDRKQYGRRWVAGNNNFFRHVAACQGAASSRETKEKE